MNRSRMSHQKRVLSQRRGSLNEERLRCLHRKIMTSLEWMTVLNASPVIHRMMISLKRFEDHDHCLNINSSLPCNQTCDVFRRKASFFSKNVLSFDQPRDQRLTPPKILERYYCWAHISQVSKL